MRLWQYGALSTIEKHMLLWEAVDISHYLEVGESARSEIKWNQMKPNETKWYQLKSGETKWDQMKSSATNWNQVTQSGAKSNP